MKTPLLLAAILMTVLAGCETMPQMAYTPEVRKMSYCSDILFKDSLNGVMMMDSMFSHGVKARRIVKIEVIVPYDNQRVGIERWTISREEHETVAYIIKMIPDGHGGTDFNIGKDDGKALQDVPLLPPPAK
jgi:hypothetical protein